MTQSFTGRKRVRKSFGRISEITRAEPHRSAEMSYDHFCRSS